MLGYVVLAKISLNRIEVNRKGVKIMASIRKRGDSYLLVVSMGYDHNGKRRAARQKTVKPPNGLTPKQKEKWLNEQAVFFEKECKETPLTVDKSITLEEYVKIWLRDVAPDKLAKATLARDRQDIGRFMPCPRPVQADRAPSGALPEALRRTPDTQKSEHWHADLRAYRRRCPRLPLRNPV